MLDNYNAFIMIDSKRVEHTEMYISEAEVMFSEGNGYITFYSFNPRHSERKVAKTLRDLGYTNEIVFV